MSRKVFYVLLILSIVMSQSSCLYGNIVDNKYRTNCVGNLTPCDSVEYGVGSPTYVWSEGYFDQLRTNYLNLYNTNTQISRDGAGNMIFTDAITGTHTLADLTVGSGGNVTGGGTANTLTMWTAPTQIGDSTITYGAGAYDFNGALLSDVADPVGNQDAATRNYVDTHGNITGYGAPTRLAYFDGTQSIGDSSIYFDVGANNYGVGTLLPTYTWDVAGDIHSTGDIDTAQDVNAGNDVNVTNDLDVTDDVDIGGDLVVVGRTNTTTLHVGTATPLYGLYSGTAFMSQLQLGGSAVIRSQNWSTSQLNFSHDAVIPESTGTGSYDYTGGAYERLFTATAPIFSATDETRPSMILIMSGTYVGAVAEVEHYVSNTQVILTGENGFDQDLTNVAFGVMPPPRFGVADTGAAVHSTFGINTFMFRSTDATSPYPFFIYTDNAGNDISTVQINVDNNGYDDNEAIDIVYNAGNMTAGQLASILKVTADVSGATTADNSTEIDFIQIDKVGSNDAETHAIHVGQGFDTAMSVSGGQRLDPNYGYTVTAAHAVTDRVTGVAPLGTAFLESSAGNVQIFVAQNDYILIGSNATFEAIPVYLTTPASHSVIPTYYYSTGAGTWATLPASDTTGGFTANGIVSFTAPSGWATTNVVVPAGAAITSGYYVKIVRTRGTLVTVPTESFFKIYTSSSTTDFQIRGDGTIRPVHMADVSAPNDSIYYSTTSNKLCYKDSGGTVNALY